MTTEWKKSNISVADKQPIGTQHLRFFYKCKKHYKQAINFLRMQTRNYWYFQNSKICQLGTGQVSFMIKQLNFFSSLHSTVSPIVFLFSLRFRIQHFGTLVIHMVKQNRNSYFFSTKRRQLFKRTNDHLKQNIKWSNLWSASCLICF